MVLGMMRMVVCLKSAILLTQCAQKGLQVVSEQFLWFVPVRFVKADDEASRMRRGHAALRMEGGDILSDR